MLIIRDEQLAALERALRLHQARRLAEELRGRHPRQTRHLDERGLWSHVLAAQERARGYGLVDDRDLTAFATLSVVVSAHFDLHPPFQDVLTDPLLAAPERIATLFRRASHADWRAAAHYRRPPARE